MNYYCFLIYLFLIYRFFLYYFFYGGLDWQFKYFQDITTCTPIGESLYNADGSVNTHKISVLSRTYAPIVAGSIVSNMFHPLTGSFDFSFVPSDAISDSAVDASITSIYFNRELYYPHGAQLTFASEDMKSKFQVTCGSGRAGGFELKQIAAAAGAVVELSVKPCGLLNRDACTC